MDTITLGTIREAADRIAPYIHRTPLQTSRSIAERSRHISCYFKCEVLQKTGSFKIRGASNAAFKHRPPAIVTHSSGNHAQAVALAAQLLGVPAYVVMPNNSPLTKIAAVRGYGGIVHLCEPTNTAREQTAQKIQEETQALFIHPSNNPDVISGQGTIALEILDQFCESFSDRTLHAVIVPVGGGGMLAGIALAIKSINPSIRVLGAEPSAADDAYRSLVSGTLQTHETLPNTVADGLKTCMGSYNWPIVRDNVDAIITVSDEEILDATRFVWERMKLCIEPSAGTGPAVLMSSKFHEYCQATWPELTSTDDWSGLNVAVVLCGGNLDISRIAELFPR